jgi:hypothetical protein
VIRQSVFGDPIKIFIIQVAALSRAATQVPEITVASQSFLKAGFLSAIQVELLFMIRGLHPVTNKGSPVSEFEKFCSET